VGRGWEAVRGVILASWHVLAAVDGGVRDIRHCQGFAAVVEDFSQCQHQASDVLNVFWQC
jgi:hypothetical protein